MRRYSIIADCPAGSAPAVGTIVPSDMAQPDDVVTLPLGGRFEPREFPDLALFLEQWGLPRGALPDNGAQIEAERIPVISDRRALPPLPGRDAVPVRL